MTAQPGDTVAQVTAPASGARDDAHAAPHFLSRKVVGGVPWAVLSKAILFAVHLAVSIVAVRVLGPERFGLYALGRSVAEYLVVLLGMGLNTAVVRFLPELLVARNRAGIVRLLWQAGRIQAAGVAIAGICVWATGGAEGRFGALGPLLPLVVFLVGAQLAKDFVIDAFTGLFRVPAAALLAAAHGLLWVVAFGTFLPASAGPETAIAAQAGAAAAVFLVGAVLLSRHVRAMGWQSPERGLGTRRVLRTALPSLLNAASNMLMRKYTEVFFLGIAFTPAVVGTFDLGYSVPLMVITFVPMAVQKLLTSGFSEAYARNEQSLPGLIAFFYKALIVTVAPMSVFGAFFAGRAVALVYGPEMAAAGWIAQSFFILHALNLVHVPLSVAIVAREKILQTVPLTLGQIAVKVGLDALLIPRFGLAGAVAAAGGAFVLTIVPHMAILSRLIGGIPFPWAFAGRVALVTTGLAAAARLLLRPEGGAGLVAAALVFSAAYPAALRFFGVVGDGDVTQLRRLDVRGLNRGLDWLVGR